VATNEAEAQEAEVADVATVAVVAKNEFTADEAVNE
jgi:hypothetical protein